jgi:hypothetical protein
MRCTKCKQTIENLASYYKTKPYHYDCLKKLKTKSDIIPRAENLYTRSWKKRYEAIVKEFRLIEQDINSKTLKQYELILKGLELILKIKGRTSYHILADDFGISLHHLKRLISLKNCTKWTWEQIKQGNISANKVCIITYEKGKKNQEEIVKWAIETKASNIEIHNFTTMNDKSKDGLIDNLGKIQRELIRLHRKLDTIEIDDLELQNKEKLCSLMICCRDKLEETIKRFK